jgi:hypothetical protein
MNTLIEFLDIIHHLNFCLKRRFGDRSQNRPLKQQNSTMDNDQEVDYYADD